MVKDEDIKKRIAKKAIHFKSTKEISIPKGETKHKVYVLVNNISIGTYKGVVKKDILKIQTKTTYMTPREFIEEFGVEIYDKFYNINTYGGDKNREEIFKGFIIATEEILEEVFKK